MHSVDKHSFMEMELIEFEKRHPSINVKMKIIEQRFLWVIT